LNLLKILRINIAKAQIYFAQLSYQFLLLDIAGKHYYITNPPIFSAVRSEQKELESSPQLVSIYNKYLINL